MIVLDWLVEIEQYMLIHYMCFTTCTSDTDISNDNDFLKILKFLILFFVMCSMGQSDSISTKKVLKMLLFIFFPFVF